MSGSLFSDSWYRVADLKPRIRGHAHIHRHRYRGETWYVLQDLASGRVHRFSTAGYLVIGFMDGRRTVQQIWETALHRLGDDAPTQDEVIQLLSQLHSADVLQCDVSPDAGEVLQRYERQQWRKLVGQLMSPLWWRIPLFDPERFLSRLLPWVRPLVSVPGACLWATVVGVAFVLAAVHWNDLTANFLDQLLSLQNLVILWLLFPVLKAVHELGHGITTKAFGGEVHDMGLMFLVFSPLPYVDVSSTSAFPSKWHRILVGAAGMLVELFLGSLALFIWLVAEPGVVRTVAYNAFLIAGISTVLFNGNPLLRYDGYYMLADLLEIPNLYTRSRAYVGYLCERYLFGQKEAEPPLAAPKECAWFVAYVVGSFIYRILVVVTIAFVLLQKFFYVGMLAVAMLLAAWLIVPLFGVLRYVFTGPRLQRVRVRAVTVTLALAALVVAAIGFVPVPFRTSAEGVVWIAEDAQVRAIVDGFVDRVIAQPGTQVRRGEVLIECRDATLAGRAQVLTARLRELRARYDEQRPVDRVKAAIVQEEIHYAEEDLARVREQLAGLTLYSLAPGTFVVPAAADLPGRFVRRGDLLGYVVNLDTVTVRAVVPQAIVDLVRHHTRAVEVRLSERIAEALPAVVKREVPGGSEDLPSPALGHGGGGAVAVDPRDSHGMKAMEKVFQIDLELPSDLKLLNVGGRVYVRFDHGWETLAVQWERLLRQLFLARLNV
jgi:putative peptide zinc metalloprotease protein